MLGLFRRRSAPSPASEAARTLGQIARNNAEARRRAMTDQLRADLLAKGHAHMTPFDWGKR